MEFEENANINAIGKTIGFVIAYLIFTIITFLIYYYLKNVRLCCIFQITLITLGITIIGILLKEFLK